MIVMASVAGNNRFFRPRRQPEKRTGELRGPAGNQRENAELSAGTKERMHRINDNRFLEKYVCLAQEK